MFNLLEFENNFKIVNFLDKGEFGKVYLCNSIYENNALFAIKKTEVGKFG